MTRLIMVAVLMASAQAGSGHTTTTVDASLVRPGETVDCFTQYFECSTRTDGPVDVDCYEQFIACLAPQIG